MKYDDKSRAASAYATPAGRLTTANAVIDALGGTKAVADLLSVGASSVSNYRRLGFPARAYFSLAKACETRGLNVADAVFGGVSSRAQPTQRQAAKSQHTPALEMFTAHGFTACHTPILQPAGPFIDRMGEEMRRRLYMFTDPGGEQVCLRPDLTIPSALAYLADPQNSASAASPAKAKLAYEGLAFRYQSRGAGKPEEFYQAGVEIIGGTPEQSLSDEAEILRVILQAVDAAGVRTYEIVLNNLGMFTQFLTALGVSLGTKKRLERAYHQSANFEAVVQNLLTEAQRPQPARDIGFVTGDANDEIAGRSIGEINARIERLQSEAGDQLTQAQATAILRFMQLSGPAASVMQDLQALLGDASAMTSFNDDWQALFGQAGLAQNDANKQVFIATAQGRKMAYYTGLAFEVHVPGLQAQRVIASGGRYDDLLQSLGAQNPINAIGGAIALERLEAASQQQGGSL